MTEGHGCQMAIARFIDRMCLALWASGLWLRYATLQNLIPSFPRIAPPLPPPWRNPKDQILPSGNLDPKALGQSAVEKYLFFVAQIIFDHAAFPSVKFYFVRGYGTAEM